MNYSNTNIKNNQSFFAKVETVRILLFHFLVDLLRIHKKHFTRFGEKKVENPANGASLQKSKSKSKNVKLKQT